MWFYFGFGTGIMTVFTLFVVLFFYCNRKRKPEKANKVNEPLVKMNSKEKRGL